MRNFQELGWPGPRKRLWEAMKCEGYLFQEWIEKGIYILINSILAFNQLLVGFCWKALPPRQTVHCIVRYLKQVISCQHKLFSNRWWGILQCAKSFTKQNAEHHYQKNCYPWIALLKNATANLPGQICIQTFQSVQMCCFLNEFHHEVEQWIHLQLLLLDQQYSFQEMDLSAGGWVCFLSLAILHLDFYVRREQTFSQSLWYRNWKTCLRIHQPNRAVPVRPGLSVNTLCLKSRSQWRLAWILQDFFNVSLVIKMNDWYVPKVMFFHNGSISPKLIWQRK